MLQHEGVRSDRRKWRERDKNKFNSKRDARRRWRGDAILLATKLWAFSKGHSMQLNNSSAHCWSRLD